MTAQQTDQLAQQVTFAVSKILSGSLPYDEALTQVLQSMCQQTQWQSSSFWKLDESSKQLRCVAFYSAAPYPNFETITRAITFEKGVGLPGRVWLEHSPVWLSDVTREDNFPRAKQGKLDGLHAGFAVPVSVNDKFIGVLEFFSSEISEPNETLLRSFAVVGSELGQFFDRHRYATALALQAKLNDYAAEIGSIVNKLDTLPTILEQCARVTLQYLDLVRVRIEVNGEECPNLIASQSTDNPIEEKQEIEIPLVLDNTVLGAIAIFGASRLPQTTIEACTRAANYLAPCIARKLAEQRLKDSEKRFRIFADNVDECLFISAPQLTKHFYVSPAFEKIWGIPVAEVYTNPSVWSRSIVPEHVARVTDYVSRLKGSEMPEERSIEYEIIRPDGAKLWLSVKIFAVVDKQDGSYNICGSVSNITERKNAEKRVSDFYLTVSHELRTPLTSLKGALLLLERRHAGTLSERAQAITHLARKECDRLIRLISDMLDMKKIEAGMLQLHRQSVSPQELIAQTKAMLTNLAAENEIELVEDIQTSENVCADKDRITQVLTNLISNAIKFSDKNTKVFLRAESTNEMIRFSIIDCGFGIIEQDQDRLFKVFEQLSHGSDRGIKGTGLGLAICKGIVAEHEGRIGVISAAGKGSTFWFELPRELAKSS